MSDSENDPVEVERFIQTFEVYERTYLPEGMTENQREALLRAFFAGAAMIVGTIQAMIAEGASIQAVKERVDFAQSDIMSELALRDARLQ